MIRSRATGISAGIVAAFACTAAFAAQESPLVEESTITLANVSGRIDHLAVDLARKHLFIAEIGNNTVEAIDLTTKKSFIASPAWTSRRASPICLNPT